MTKTDFLEILEQKLMVLNENERADILLEYEQHIEMKIASGLSEEQAIEDFGDLDDLAKEILDAYHINTSYSNGNVFKKKMMYYAKSCAHFMTNLTESLFTMNRAQLGQLFLKFIGLLLFIFCFRFILELVANVLHPLINIFPYFLSAPLFGILYFVINLIHLVVAVYVLVFFVEKYVLVDYQPIVYPNPDDPFSTETLNTLKQKSAFIKEKTLEKTNTIKDKIAQDHSSVDLWELCIKILAFTCKFLAIFVLLLPLAMILLGLVIALGFFIVFCLQGISCIGITCMLLGCVLLSAGFFAAIYRFIFEGGQSL